MTHIALARKWRPRTFSQLVGQDHINQALTRSLERNRIHHAYLFSGTRGVGKTSIARLFAKSLNCESGIHSEPCLKCSACSAIEQGRFIDLIEIDGASKTRVEDTRELLDNVQYAPTNGRFKIYLIDEVHMLSQHSFNALLKTLEEPPEHVKFLLATTDPQKLPITVLSRCLQFHLKPIQPEVISQRLAFILQQEALSFEEQAISIIAKAAQGSMRDALSLLDQAIAVSDATIEEKKIQYLLGHTQEDYAIKLLTALVKRQLDRLLEISHTIAQEGSNYQYVLEEMLTRLHQICIAQCLGAASKQQSEIAALSDELSAEDAHLFYQIAQKGLEELHLSPSTAVGFEMTLLRMHCFQPAMNQPTPALNQKPASKEKIGPLPKTKETTKTPQEKPKSLANKQPIEQPIPAQPSPPQILTKNESIQETKVPPAPSDFSWHAFTAQSQLSGLALSAAEHAEFMDKTANKIILKVKKSHLSLFTPAITKRIEEALAKHFLEKVTLQLEANKGEVSSPAFKKKVDAEKSKEQAEQSLKNDPCFQTLQSELSGELLPDSVQPIKNDL